MAEIKSDIEHDGIFFDYPACENEEIELGQSYCQDCGEPLEWTEDE